MFSATKYYEIKDSAESPMLKEEINLNSTWKSLKPKFTQKISKKTHLVKLIDYFKQIKEFSRMTPRKVFEEFFECLENDSTKRIFKQDIDMMFHVAEIYLNFGKLSQAQNLYQTPPKACYKK